MTSIICLDPVSQLAVLQKNLPAVHLIWENYIKHYSMSILPLRKFIWSFTRLGDLKSAYKTLQQMVSLTVRGNISIARRADGKLYSTRLDIPIPSNRELGSTLLDLEENKQLDSWICPPFEYFPDAIYAGIEQQIILMGNKEAKCAELDGLNGQQHSLHMKVLRWSFNDVIHGCAQHKNAELARKLILQVDHSTKLVYALCNGSSKTGSVESIVCVRTPNINTDANVTPVPCNITPSNSVLPYAKVYTRKNRKREDDMGKACGQEGMGGTCN